MEGHVVPAGLDPSFDRPISYRIIDGMAEHTGRAIDDLPQLYDVIDPEALDALFMTNNGMLDGHLSFEYADHVITVHSTGDIEIESPD